MVKKIVNTEVVDFFELSDNPRKGKAVELQTVTLVIPPLTINDYVNHDADLKLVKIIDYAKKQDSIRVNALQKFAPIQAKIQDEGVASLTIEEQVALSEFSSNLDSTNSLDKDIFKTSVELILLAAKKNYPNLTIEALYEEIDLSTMQNILPLIQSQAQEERELPKKTESKNAQ